MDRYVTRRVPRRRITPTRVNVRRRRTVSRGLVFPKGISLKYHQFIRSASVTAGRLSFNPTTGFAWNGVSLGTNNLQFSFALSGFSIFAAGSATAFAVLALPNYTELTALYDQYKIDYIEMQFMFSNNNSSVNSPQTTLPIVYLAKDYDDTSNAGVTDIQQYATQQIWQVGQQQGKDGIHRVFVKPNVDVAVYNTAIANGYARGKPMFVDSGSPNVPHYGVKLAVDAINNPGASDLGYFAINCVYHLTMAHTK